MQAQTGDKKTPLVSFAGVPLEASVSAHASEISDFVAGSGIPATKVRAPVSQAAPASCCAGFRVHTLDVAVCIRRRQQINKAQAQACGGNF